MTCTQTRPEETYRLPTDLPTLELTHRSPSSILHVGRCSQMIGVVVEVRRLRHRNRQLLPLVL